LSVFRGINFLGYRRGVDSHLHYFLCLLLPMS